ncbi:Crp/Fnr family transcriptional regulator [Methylobrevis pamukkalensis]|nr:Crp/Fnr family transcriptional regulator [Methylobrevis pamukkalensis]
MTDIADLLRAQSLFAGLDDPDIAAVAALARRRAWPAGTLLFQRGDAGREMILVTSGRVRLSLLSPEGRELTLRHAEAGSLFGEIAVLDGGPRSADATAAAETEGLVIAKADLDRLMAARPQIAAAVIRFLCGRLRETTEQFETVALYRLEARLARFLLGLARPQVAGADASSVRIDLPLTQSEIAT